MPDLARSLGKRSRRSLRRFLRFRENRAMPAAMGSITSVNEVRAIDLSVDLLLQSGHWRSANSAMPPTTQPAGFPSENSASPFESCERHRPGTRAPSAVRPRSPSHAIGQYTIVGAFWLDSVVVLVTNDADDFAPRGLRTFSNALPHCRCRGLPILSREVFRYQHYVLVFSYMSVHVISRPAISDCPSSRK